MIDFRAPDKIPDWKVKSKEEDGIYSLAKAPFFLVGRYYDTYEEHKAKYGLGFAAYYEKVFMPYILEGKNQEVILLNQETDTKLHNANVDAVLINKVGRKKFVRAVECKAFNGYYDSPPFYLRSSQKQTDALRNLSKNSVIMEYLKKRKLNKLVSAPSLLLFFSREFVRPDLTKAKGTWVVTVWCLMQNNKSHHMDGLKKNKKSFKNYKDFLKRHEEIAKTISLL